VRSGRVGLRNLSGGQRWRRDESEDQIGEHAVDAGTSVSWHARFYHGRPDPLPPSVGPGHPSKATSRPY
jgi:hypothetical protein